MYRILSILSRIYTDLYCVHYCIHDCSEILHFLCAPSPSVSKVRGAAEESIRGVALDAAALLRDFGRADFGAAAGQLRATQGRKK